MCHGGTEIVMCVMMRQVKHDTLHSDRIWALAARHLAQQSDKDSVNTGNRGFHGISFFFIRMSEWVILENCIKIYLGPPEPRVFSIGCCLRPRDLQRKRNTSIGGKGASRPRRHFVLIFNKNKDKINTVRATKNGKTDALRFGAIRCSIDTLLFFCSSNGTHLRRTAEIFRFCVWIFSNEYGPVWVVGLCG